ncbi:MAG TPA: threonine aldolase family protein [Bryobacteraceae bacterium]|nr:threonine aldolase family protein [Bryobacteraceae bacterium]
MIDLRSDTVTKPTAAMRKAMAEAEVGDDVYGEDPTVNRLEVRAAEIAGKEAAMFVPSGTMGNTIAIKLLTQHGEEVICDSRAHLFDWELSMLAWFSGCQIRSAEAPDGILTWDRIRPILKSGSPHSSRTGAIEIENTHNMAGGRVYPQEIVDEICDRAHEAGVPVHMDGARVFNASTATRRPVREIAAKVDTLMFCLSKALGAPVGSILAGPAHLIEQGRLYRKRLGGGMRQAGVLAAAGLIALEESPKCLGIDHANAQLIAEGLRRIAGVTVRPVETNIVIFDLPAHCQPAAVSAALKARGILMNPVNNLFMRAVTHYDVTRAECLEAVDALTKIVGN